MTDRSDRGVRASLSLSRPVRRGVAVLVVSCVALYAALLLMRGRHDNNRHHESPQGGEAVAASASAAPQAQTVSGKGPASPAQKVIAYYFHGTFRCPSCRRIELYTQEALETACADALRDGRLEWRVLNIDEPENAHFINDYRLYTRSVILSEVREGKEVRWKNLDRVWRLLGDKEAFLDYVRTEVAAYLAYPGGT